MVLDIIGDLFTHGRQLKHLVFDDRIVGPLGELPILGGFVPEIVSPIHVVQSSEPGAVTANAWRKAVRSRLRHDDTKTDLVQEEEIKPRHATYGDGITIRLTPIGGGRQRANSARLSPETR
jgi:hypothetical protein